MKSVRTRLALGMSGLIIFFVAFSLLINSQFLGRYYISKKRENLIQSKNHIEKIYKGNPEEISFELESMERNRGLNISFLSPDFDLKYNSSFRINTGFRRRAPDRPPVFFWGHKEAVDLPKGEFIMDVMVDPRLNTKFLFLASRLNNGDLLVLNSPLTAINESAAIANRFFLFTGLLTSLIGGIAVFIFARRFTKPILDLNEIAQRMSRLDFSSKYSVESEDEVGQLGRSINSLSDQLDEAISELQEANKKLKQDIEHERRLDKMRKEFVSNVSHEFKTPISLIQGYAEGLKLNVNEDEESKDFYCDVIMDEAVKMDRLVRDLLDLSQMESGYFKLEKTAFDISCLADHVIDKYRPIFREKDIQITVSKDGDMAVYGDSARIEQVLVNFLNNAINHVDETGVISVTVSARADKVRLSVYNSGKNIPEEAIDKLWTSFYKVDKARTRVYGGTGLGLSVVRAILELHRSAFGVENQAGGVVFWFELDQASVIE